MHVDCCTSSSCCVAVLKRSLSVLSLSCSSPPVVFTPHRPEPASDSASALTLKHLPSQCAVSLEITHTHTHTHTQSHLQLHGVINILTFHLSSSCTEKPGGGEEGR